MSQFSPQKYFNRYKVSAKPNDWIRRHLVPKLNLCLLPYFCGADISLDIKIEPIKHNTQPEVLEYDLLLYKKGNKNPEILTPSSNKVNMLQENKIIVKLRHFSFTDEYELVAKIRNNSEVESHTIADFEITSRANMQMAIIWFIVASFFSLISFLLGLWLGG